MSTTQRYLLSAGILLLAMIGTLIYSSSSQDEDSGLVDATTVTVESTDATTLPESQNDSGTSEPAETLPVEQTTDAVSAG